ILRVLSRYERVNLLVADDAMESSARANLGPAGADLGNIRFHHLQTDRSWMRDSGPIFIIDSSGRNGVLDFHFNAWAKYPDWRADDLVPAFAAQTFGLDRWQPTHKDRRVVLEGGSIEVNGKGLLITTEECLLSDVQERNPGFGRSDYEQVFANY